MAIFTSPVFKKNCLKSLHMIASNTPLPVLGVFAWLASFLLARILKRDREIAIAQLNLVLPELSAESIYRQAIYGAILTVFESFQIKKILGIKKDDTVSGYPKSQFGCMKIIGLSELKEDSNATKEFHPEGKNFPQSVGGVCLSAHCGNFDLMAACFSFQNFPMSVIARNANDPVYHQFLTSLREGYGIQMLWRESTGGSKNLISAIRNNRFLCALIDQDVALDNAFTQFFGIPAAHPVAPIQIAVKFKRPIYTCFSRRIRIGEHECYIRRIHWEEVKNNPEQFILKEYSRLLENFIRDYPDQWVWWHRRWRRREGVDYKKYPEKLPSTKEYIHWIKNHSLEQLP